MEGYLNIFVYSDTIANPVKNASITILKDDNVVLTTSTNEDGKTETLTLDSVNVDLSLEEQDETRPYETYDLVVESLGLTKTTIEGVQIFPGVTSLQNVYLTSIDESEETTLSIDENNLWNNTSSPYISDDETTLSYSYYVLRRVIIPETIIVHNGIPSNTSASNYTVEFTDYIKNVASSEIYSTWPEETIKANVLAIISFTLNRIYTEWYPSKGYSFDITSTSSYDQKYTVNGTIFSTISDIVDEIFTNYIRYSIRREPLLAHYLSSTTEEGYLSQWGSKSLGDKGYTALEILRYYYGEDINIYEAYASNTSTYSFTETLSEGDCSIDVYTLQNTLNYIHSSYPGIPLIENPTGLYDPQTTASVKKFQNVFGLTETGTVNYQTWYKISYIYVAVSNMTNSIY